MSRRHTRQVLPQIEVAFNKDDSTQVFDLIGLSTTKKSIKVHNPETKEVSYLKLKKISYKEL